MAGKHVGSIENTNITPPGQPTQTRNFRCIYPGTRVDRAYAAGRAAGIAQATFAPANPFVSGSPAFNAFQLGGQCYNTDLAVNVVQTGIWNNPAEPNP